MSNTSSFNGATAFRRWKLPKKGPRPETRHLALQWGHRLSAMETFPAQTAVRQWSSSFNGATAFRRWKRLFVARLRHGFMQKRSFPEESVTG